MNVSQLQVRRLDAPFGAEIVGFDARAELSEEVAAWLREAWNEYDLLLFRGQQLDVEQQERFALTFGAIGEGTTANYNMYVSNVTKGGLNPSGPLDFHSDASMEPAMLLGLMLYALEAPPPGEGGETLFANARLAFDSLPERLKKGIEPLTIRHGNPDVTKGVALPGLVTGPNARRADRRLAMKHPVTGKKLLFLSRRHADRILELDPGDSLALIEELTRYVRRPELTYTHPWRVGDLVIWDNFTIQHGRNDFDPKWKRHLRRTQIAEPFPTLIAVT
jgi:taurine dioxygenase